MKIAFVVLTYNQPTTVLQVLNALALQCDSDHEVIIADDGSNAASVMALRSAMPRFHCKVSHVWHPDSGFTASRARNLGAKHSSSDYLVFMDGDCIPNPDFVKSHKHMAQAGYFVNGNRVLLSQNLSQKIVNREIDIQGAHWYDWLRWRWTGDSNKLLHLLYWPHAPFRKSKSFRWKKIRSCNFGVWKKDFLQVNGFDESFNGWGHEDADIVLRLHNAGVHRKNGFCATEVYHLWHQENSRASEMRNRDIVIHRSQTGISVALIGINDSCDPNEVQVTLFN